MAMMRRLSILAALCLAGCSPVLAQSPQFMDLWALASPASAYVVPTNGLVAWYKLDGNAQDSSTNAIHGTASGAPAPLEVAGVSGTAMQFAGTNSLAGSIIKMPAGEISARLHGATSVTYSAWINFTRLNTTQKWIFHESIQGNNLGGFDLCVLATNRIRVGGRSIYSDTYQLVAMTNALPTNEWHHVVGVHSISADSIQLYIDGALATNAAVTFGATTYTDANDQQYQDTIGNDPYNNANFDVGAVIDDACVWRRGLGADEILQMYNSLGGQ